MEITALGGLARDGGDRLLHVDGAGSGAAACATDPPLTSLRRSGCTDFGRAAGGLVAWVAHPATE